LKAGEELSSVVAVRRVGKNDVIMPYAVYKNGNLTFYITQTGTYDVIYNKQDYIDVKGHWAESYIDFLSARGLVSNSTDGVNMFTPEQKVTRATFAAMFARLGSADLSKYKTSKFDDVPDGEWYTAAVQWAAEKKIIEGVGENMFAPNSLVTREEMAIMLDRFIKYKGWSLKPANEEIIFADNSSISGYAKEAVENIQHYGIILGRPGNVYDPKGITTRGEYAAIFTRLIEASECGIADISDKTHAKGKK